MRFDEVLEQTRAKAVPLVPIVGVLPQGDDPGITDLVRGVAIRLLGEDEVLENEPTTGGDDMAYFQQKVPGCYFIVGGASKGPEPFGPHHSVVFDFDEEALKVGLKVMCGAALEYLS